MKNKAEVGEQLVEDLVNNPEYQEIVRIIDKEVDYVGIKPYSHNIIGMTLLSCSKKFGNAVANDLIEEFGLERLGWQKHHEDKDEVD